MIVIIDYGMGNLRSILNKIEKMGFDAIISSESVDIQRADKLILPGVGSFDSGMDNLKKYELISSLTKKVIEEKTPILGICLGMQLLTKSSEEGTKAGLSWVNASCKKFNFDTRALNLKIPHMGWNSISIRKEDPLLENISTGSKFYFVHSYHVVCNDPTILLATVEYGHEVTSIIKKENIYGTQFHPEKSHTEGLTLLKNFITRC